MSARHWSMTTWMAALICLVGCGGGPSKVPVTGIVTFEGAPVKDGQIAFEPRGEGKMQFGVITDGKYSIPEEFGLIPGEYLVRITASRSTGQKAETNAFVSAEDALEVNEQFIPARYNSASELLVTIESGAEAKQDFSLTK